MLTHSTGCPLCGAKTALLGFPLCVAHEAEFRTSPEAAGDLSTADLVRAAYEKFINRKKVAP